LANDIERPDDGSLFIERTRRWGDKESGLGRPPTLEGPFTERRALDRRGNSTTARRREDAERNQRSRALVLAYLSTLSHEDLLLWAKGLWLGNATDAQLAALVDRVRDSAAFVYRTSHERAPGRPQSSERIPGVQSIDNAWLRAEWRNLSEQLTILADLRRQHHARPNQKRNGTPKSSQYRDACLESPVGRRVEQAALFDEFFGSTDLTPAEMAARLLDREVQNQLRVLAAPPERRRSTLGPFTAAAAVTALTLFPTWKSLFRKLRTRAESGPSSKNPPDAGG
jgi:hypothetical protein